MHLQLDDDSDEESQPQVDARRRHSRTKVHDFDYWRVPAKKQGQDVDDEQDSQGTMSDERELEGNSASSAIKPQVFKVSWNYHDVKDYDRNKVSVEASYEDIAQITQDSLKDANFYAENVEQRLPTGLGYFKVQTNSC